MLKINKTQYIDLEDGGMTFYDRQFRSMIYKYIEGNPPALNLFNHYRDIPGRKAVLWSSHWFFISTNNT